MTKSDALEAVNGLIDMGFGTEVALGAMNAIKCNDLPTLRNHILSKGIL